MNTLTPQEKAKELVDKMLYFYQGHIDKYTAKQCALIAVDEITKATTPLTSTYFWQDVKQEIEKL